MNELEMKITRILFGIPKRVTDADIKEAEAYLKECEELNTPGWIRTANFMRLEEIRKPLLPNNPKPGMVCDDDEIPWLCWCERFFVDCLFGPCCLWARATLEHDLIEKCLSSSGVPQEFKNRILDSDAQNPSIHECLKQLGIATSSELFKASMVIKDNGNWVTHHRIDRLTGREPEVLFREIGKSEEFIEALMRSGKREMGVEYRQGFERYRATESMKSLYLFKAEIGK